MSEVDIKIYKICLIRSPDEYKQSPPPVVTSDVAAAASSPNVKEAEALAGAEAGSANIENKEQEQEQQQLCRDNVLYVFYGDTVGVISQNVDEYEVEGDKMTVNIAELFESNPEHSIFTTIFSKYELEAIQRTNIKVVFLPEKIYPDDSIETIKKKFLLHTRTELRLTYGDLYFYCKQIKQIKSNHVNDQLTSNGRMEITPIRLHNFLLNIDNHPKEIVNYGCADLSEEEATQYTDFTKLGPPASESGNYGYSNIINLKLDGERMMNMVIGQELSSVSHDYPYAVDPFDANYIDPFLESHISEIINTTNKQVLLDLGVLVNNTIYLVTAEDVLKYVESLNADDLPAIHKTVFQNMKFINSEYVIKLYFPYLALFKDDVRRSLVERTMAASEGDADLTTIHSLDTLRLHREKLYEMDNKILNEKFIKQTSNVKLLYDIYEQRDPAKELSYLDNGIRGIEFIIHPDVKYNLSLDTLFKKIHTNKDIPLMKLNPGKRLDNIYKLFIKGVSKSGRKIPYLPKSDIFHFMKTYGKKKSLSLYIRYKYVDAMDQNHKAYNQNISVICEIHPDGCVHVKTYFTYSFAKDEIDHIIRDTINPVLNAVKIYVEQSGYEMSLFHSLNDENIDIVNIEYFLQFENKQNIEIKSMIRCLSSVFNEFEGSLKKGILLRYKRVSNYNDMSSQEAYIIEMMNKRYTDRDIIDGLRENYMLDEEDAKMKIASLYNSIQLQQISRYRGGTIRIKNNPGFLTKITQDQFNNVLTVEISNINNIFYLGILYVYINSIIRIYQDPSSTKEPGEYLEKIQQLCSNAQQAKPSKSALGKQRTMAASSAEQNLSDIQQASDDDASELSTFLKISQNKAVTKEVNKENSEFEVEGIADITSVTRKPYPESVTSAILGEKLVFGFEAENEMKVGNVELGRQDADDYEAFFGLIDEDEDEEDVGGEEEEFLGGGGKKGDSGAAAAAPKSTKGKARGGVVDESDESDVGEEEEKWSGRFMGEDITDIAGMELSNPNPFSKRIQERDPDIHLNEDVGKFNAYSRSCPGHYGRQPVILTDEEKAKIDKEHPGSYSQSIKYGSNPKNQYNYICPRYWSLKHNTSLTEEEVKSGKYGKVIPHKAKRIPPGTNIFEFTDDKYHIDEKGNYKQHYPGFLKKDVHPKGLCVPCCFSQWDKPSQTKRRQECETKTHEKMQIETVSKSSRGAAVGKKGTAQSKASAANADADASSIRPENIEESPEQLRSDEMNPYTAPAASQPQTLLTSIESLSNPKLQGVAATSSSSSSSSGVLEQDKMFDKKDERVLSSEKFPLDNGRWGYLPIQIQKFLFTDNRNCQISIKNSALKKNTPCLLRRGVEPNEKQSFLSVIAYYYMEYKGENKMVAMVEDEEFNAPNALNASQNLQEVFGEEGVQEKSILYERSESANLQSESAVDYALSKMIKLNAPSQTGKSKSLKSATPLNMRESGGIVNIPPPSSKNMMVDTVADASAEQDKQLGESAYSSSSSSGAAVMPVRSSDGSSEGGPKVKPPTRVSTSKTINSDYMLTERVHTIKEMRHIIKESLDLDIFIQLQNGTLVDVFYNNETEIQDSDLVKYKSSTIYNKIRETNVSGEGNVQTNVMFHKMCNAFENFLSYLSKDDVVIDHTYLWDIISIPNPKLFKKGNNIILIRIPDDDITNNVEVICPTNAYSNHTFDPNKRTILIMKRDAYYEPIYSFETMSSNKHDIFGRFSMKSKSLNPKIKDVITRIKDIYFTYCRSHASQPNKYKKYVMNKPAKHIDMLLTDSRCGFKVESQVMNYNGKIIGLFISDHIIKRKYVKRRNASSAGVSEYEKIHINSGVIPTASSPPLLNELKSLDNSEFKYPIKMMDDESLWMNTYDDEVTFLKQVADHVKWNTGQDLNCRPKVKVVEDNHIVGIITETNQFVQVKVDDTLVDYDDGLDTVTEGNQLLADNIIMTKTAPIMDESREKYVRNVRLETNFYNVFRNTARIMLNKPENKAIKDEIEKILNSAFIVYTNKLTRIVELLKRILVKYIGFVKYPKDVLKKIGVISGCYNNDQAACANKTYCLREQGGLCKLRIPKRNLMHRSIDNEIAYYGKLSDEMIRYERVKLFIFEPTKYLTFEETKYNLFDNEIILLESLITQQYFENLIEIDSNNYAKNTSFYTVNPNQNDGAVVQAYDNLYRKEYVDLYKKQHELEYKYNKGDKGYKGDNGKATDVHGLGAGVTDVRPEISQFEPVFKGELNHILTYTAAFSGNVIGMRKITSNFKGDFFIKETNEIILPKFQSNFNVSLKDISTISHYSFDVILTILRIVAQTASKCPSGHTCNRAKRKPRGVRPEEHIADAVPAGAAEDAGFNTESEECKKCRSTIGLGETEFACRKCNYFVCDNCRHQHVERLSNINIAEIKKILVEEYEKFGNTPNTNKNLIMILKRYGMRYLANIIQEGKATFTTILQTENYCLTNVDLWILARYFKIPIVLLATTKLVENNKKLLVLYGDHSIESYFFIHPWSVSEGTISRYGLFEMKINGDVSLFRMPLDAVSPILKENILREIDADEPLTVERYIQTFKPSVKIQTGLVISSAEAVNSDREVIEGESDESGSEAEDDN